MNIVVRPETERDYPAIREINDLAFGQQNEGRLIEELRKTPDFIPALSLVAEVENKVVGHLLFYPIRINDSVIRHTVLSLAPMSVHPAYQRKGIGSKLVREGLKCAKEKGYNAVILVGHPQYYPRFGFQKAGKAGIKVPFDVPDEAFMAVELKKGALRLIRGVVEYPKPFYDAL